MYISQELLSVSGRKSCNFPRNGVIFPGSYVIFPGTFSQKAGSLVFFPGTFALEGRNFSGCFPGIFRQEMFFKKNQCEKGISKKILSKIFYEN